MVYPVINSNKSGDLKHIRISEKVFWIIEKGTACAIIVLKD